MSAYRIPEPPPEVRSTIERLVAERDAVILSHYYCRPEIHEIAHYVGDSLGLSQ